MFALCSVGLRGDGGEFGLKFGEVLWHYARRAELYGSFVARNSVDDVRGFAWVVGDHSGGKCFDDCDRGNIGAGNGDDGVGQRVTRWCGRCWRGVFGVCVGEDIAESQGGFDG